MKNTQHQPNDYVLSYLYLRQLIGVLGIGLPFFVVFGSMLVGGCGNIQISISHYYYTTMHIVFVGTLCVLGGCLITYKGKDAIENRTSNFAGAFAFCVAAFPTGFCGFKGHGEPCQFVTLPNNMPGFITLIHFGSAALLFVCFIAFCFKIFQHSDEEKAIDEKKRRRNATYKFCGWIIVISITAIAGVTLYDWKFDTNIFPYATILFETTALLAFGFSWLLKGTLDWPKSTNKIKRVAIQYFR